LEIANFTGQDDQGCAKSGYSGSVYSKKKALMRKLKSNALGAF